MALSVRERQRGKLIDGPEEAEQFYTTESLLPVQAAIEQDRLDAQLKALERNN